MCIRDRPTTTANAATAPSSTRWLDSSVAGLMPILVLSAPATAFCRLRTSIASSSAMAATIASTPPIAVTNPNAHPMVRNGSPAIALDRSCTPV